MSPSLVILESSRQFQWWAYTTSNSMLLLRSTKSDVISTRIDVLFAGVHFVQIPTRLNGLRIRQAVGDEIPSLARPFMMYDEKCFVIASADYVGLIVSRCAVWKEDVGEYFEPSP